MPRIPEDELERLKKIPLRTLAEAKGVVLMGQGENLIGKCPFHDDKEPSFVITPEKNLWHCLGACQAGGTAVDFVMKAEKVSFRHAVEILRHGGVTPGIHAGSQLATIPTLPSPIDIEADDETILRQTVEYYQETLKLSTLALAYLERRGIRNEEAIERFKIGFANRTLGLRLPDKNRKAGAAIREKLLRVGILRETGHEHFNGAVIFPILDRQGKIQGLYGRKINDNLTTCAGYHLYSPGSHKGIWNPEGVQGEEVILCEAIIDALTFWINGVRNVTASYGVNGFTPDHLAAFKAGGVKRVYIAYDRDEAGDKGAANLSPKLMAQGFEVFRVLFPMNMDANEFALASDPPDRILAALVRAAEWVGKPPASFLAADPPVPNEPAEPRAEEKSKEAAKVEETGAVEEKAPEPEPAAETAAATKPDSTTKRENAGTPEPGGLTAAVNEREVILTLGEREYRIRGLEKNTVFDAIKVNIRASRGERYHIDTLDLYQARIRQAFINQAAKQLDLDPEIINRDMGHIFRKLEEIQEELIKKSLKPEKPEFIMNDRDREKALGLLTDPNLLDRILQDFTACGIVGEESNKLAGYLAALSRKLDEPLAVLIQSSSSAGKSSLMDAILSFIPEEERVKYSAMTGQSLFYMSETNLKNKILAIAEEEGAQKAGYALKLLQSEGELTIASTGKDPKTGRLVTQEYKVTGPVMIFLTTTGIEIDEELLNRCIILSVDEDREQTRAIHERQRHNKTLEGQLNRLDARETLRLHQNAQRLLRPLLVANPYADQLTFLNDRTRTRRDHLKYLTLIQTIALLHQYQRPVKTINHKGALVCYIEVSLRDIEIANRLAHEALGRTLDELPPQTRKLLTRIEEYVEKRCQELKIHQADFRFTRREIREFSGFSATQSFTHLQRLVELEYVYSHHGRAGQTQVYELVYRGEGERGKKFMLGLADVNKLNYNENLSGVKANLSGQKGELSAPIRGRFGPDSAPIRGEVIPFPASNNATSEDVPGKNPKNAHLDSPELASYAKERYTLGG